MPDTNFETLPSICLNLGMPWIKTQSLAIVSKMSQYWITSFMKIYISTSKFVIKLLCSQRISYQNFYCRLDDICESLCLSLCLSYQFSTLSILLLRFPHVLISNILTLIFNKTPLQCLAGGGTKLPWGI